MAQIYRTNKVLCVPTVMKSYRKAFSNANYSHNLSGNIRKRFLDYFIKENSHKFIRSSPVVPYCDPTVAFVNAGMNQFKSIFLGKQDPMFSRAVNSQKCVRVGGKHNDINIVGTDGYHHTFFEMLGNWSFGDYFKREACEMAWNLLTGPYNLKPSTLYVTYFAGDPKLQLEPDLECKEIWRSIGVADDHIIPFGPKENFWEMGLTGPCGPCTEIHVDHSNGRNRSCDVNKDKPDLTELWNIVFIQHNRNEDGTISPLPMCHVDTGMGLERLTAILQGKTSNYDTDIFSNLFTTISKNCSGIPLYSGRFGTCDSNGLDTAYRILADHARMITVCLADGMIPEENQKLRRILRKSLYLTETIFNKDKLVLNELACTVAEDLGDAYPEISKNISQIQEIISYEDEVYKSIRENASKNWEKIIAIEPRLKNLNAIEMPGLILAYNDISTSKIKSINSQTAFKLYDTYGLDEETITNLSNALNLPFESQELRKELCNARMKTKQQHAVDNKLLKMFDEEIKIPKTNDCAKYDYDISYKFKPMAVNVLSIVKNDETVDRISRDEECYLILDETNVYTEAGGQLSDRGRIEFAPGKIFTITDALNVNGYVLHKGKLACDGECFLHDCERGSLAIDEKNRLQTMANHTATHLLNAAVKTVLKTATCQRSSTVSAKCLNFDVGVYGRKLSAENVEEIERCVRSVVRSAAPVETSLINSQEMLNLCDVTVVPGEIYPDTGIRLVQIGDADSGLRSREPCCGTHVLNTLDIQDVCIIGFQSLSRSTASLTAVTRDRAARAHKNGQRILRRVQALKRDHIENNNELRDLDDTIAELRHRIIHGADDNDIMPVYVKNSCLKLLSDQSKYLRNLERELLRDFIDMEMKTVMESNRNKTNTNKKFVVHYMGCSSILDSVPLQRATKVCGETPVLVLSYSENMVKARCCVPQVLASETFNAELWLKETVASVFQSTYAAPRGYDGALVCNMRPKRINKKDWETLLNRAMASAQKFANNNLC